MVVVVINYFFIYIHIYHLFSRLLDFKFNLQNLFSRYLIVILQQIQLPIMVMLLIRCFEKQLILVEATY